MKKSAVVVSSLLAIAFCPVVAIAQIGPVGTDDATVGPGGGVVSPISPLGGFQTSVPIDLPSSRGGFAIPVALRYGGGATPGAAGAGWDVPLSFVRVSDTIWLRKPSPDGHVAERVIVSIAGNTQVFVLATADPEVYLPYASDEYAELRASADGTSWTLDTAAGTEYRFVKTSALGDGSLDDDSLWLLREIIDTVGTDHAVLSYDTNAHGCGRSQLDLTGVSYGYGYGPTRRLPLYEVELKYTSWSAIDHPGLARCGLGNGQYDMLFGGTDLAGALLDRTRFIDQVIVRARNNLDAGSALEPIRTYQMNYVPDADTGAPRLAQVDMTGHRSAETLPIAAYTYGSASDDKNFGIVNYAAPTTMGLNLAAIAGSDVSEDWDMNWIWDGSGWTTVDVAIDVVTSNWTLRDFTGDGVPDYVAKASDTWSLRRGIATESGVRFETSAISTWSEPAEISRQETRHWTRFPIDTRDMRKAMVTSETIVEFLDWNADGRLDIVDAAGSGDLRSWRVWINQPTPGGGIEWNPFDVDVGNLVDHAATVFGLDYLGTGAPSRLALERSRSWPRIDSFVCAVRGTYDGVHFGDPQAECASTPSHTYSDQEDTITEWTIADLNGDSYPDVIAGGDPVRECEDEDPRDPPSHLHCDVVALNPDGTPMVSDDGATFYECYYRHAEYMWLGGCPEDDQKVFTDPMWERPPTSPAVAFYDVDGAMVGSFAQAAGIDSFSLGQQGIQRWTTAGTNPGPYSEFDTGTPLGRPLDPGVSWRSQGFYDEHGRGRLTPRAFDSPGGFEQFDSDRPTECGPGGSGTFTSKQVQGLADLNGDGSPDLVYRDELGWQVKFGTTAGFGTPHSIAMPEDFPFAISETSGSCGGASSATAGLIDVDGDGKPEVVRVVNGTLYSARVAAPVGNDLTAGRLYTIDNLHGALTVITYANNKTDTQSTHQVAAPEVVVAQTQVQSYLSTMRNLEPVRYAYGTAESRYDPVLNRVTFAGYRRFATLIGTPNTSLPMAVDGVATIVDRVPQAAHGAGFAAFAIGGHVRLSSRLEGTFSSDARFLLSAPENDARTRAQHSQTWRVTEFPVAPVPTTELFECVDVDPLTGTFVSDLLCQHAGVIGIATNSSWEGTSAPPSLNNVSRSSAVTVVDARGRPREIFDYGDVRTTGDDTCVTITYASGLSDVPTALSAVAATRVTDCGWLHPITGTAGLQPGTPSAIAGMRFSYDARGRMISRIVENYDVSTGQSLGEHVAAMITYDAAGELRQVTAMRTQGAATRTTVFERDPFAATVIQTTEQASDVAIAPLVESLSLSTWPSLESSTTDQRGAQTITYRDSFGRPVRERVIAPGVDADIATLSYVDSGDRTVTATSYPTTAAQPVTTHVHLDAIGRVRYRQTELGTDYAGSTMVSDLVDYDTLGRVAYRSAPFESAQIPYTPGPSTTAWPYGTTERYDVAGRA